MQVEIRNVLTMLHSVWLALVTGGAHAQRLAPSHATRLVESGFLEEEEGAARAEPQSSQLHVG